THALRTFIVSRGAQATFSPLPPGSAAPQGPWLVEAVSTACAGVSALEQRIMDERLKKATTLSVDPDLASLFERVGSAADLRILRAIVANRVEPSGLATHLELSQEAIDAGLKELVRRGVVRL
ncbi:MAG: hypothetical protein H6Q89_5330, partial [Myxococcaceae bacterium]|nr:hypothetical protein [Myxococcaceae bacterium]